MNERLIKLLELPPSEWRAIVEEPLPDGHGNHNGQDDRAWERDAGDLEAFGIRALLLAEYIEQRRGGYCGNHSPHDRAATEVTKRHRKLRRALGFTLPSSGLLRLS